MSTYEDKNKEQLIKEITELHKRISQLKKYEKECTLAMDSLQRGEKRYRHFVENSPNPIFSINEKGIIKSWNCACENTFQYDKSIIGKNYLVLLSSSEEQKVIKHVIKKAFHGQSLSDIDISFKAKDGAELFMVSRLYPLIDNDGRIRECVFANTNITERKRTQEELSREKNTLKNIIELNPYAIALYDKEGHFINGNNAYLRLFKKPPPKEYSIFTDPIVKKAGFQELLLKLKTGETIKVPEIWYNPHEVLPEYPDILVCVRTTAFSVFDSCSTIENYVVIYEDITEHKKAEEALKESEKRYQRLSQEFSAILDSIPDNLTFQDQNFKIIWANQTAAKSINKKIEDIVGKNCYRLWHKRRKPCKGCPVKQAMGNKSPVVGEISTPDRRFWEVRGFPIIENNKVLGVVEVARDITEAKQAEAKIRESEERYRTLFEKSPTAIALVDNSGIIIDCNQATEQLTGYSNKELIGKPFDRLLTLDDQDIPELKKKYQALIKEEVGKHYELEIMRKDGKRRWIIVMNSLLIKDEKIVGSQIIATDITVQKKTEEALRKSEEKYRSLVEESLQVIVIIQDGVIVFANPALSETTGYSNAELLLFKPEQIRALIHPDDREMVWKRLEGRLAGKDVPSYYETRAIRKDGAVCWFEMFAKRIDYHGKPAVQATLIDITDRKKTERALMESKEKFRSLAEQSPNMIFINKRGRIAYVNKKCEDIMGYKRDEFYSSGFDFFSLFAPESLDIIKSNFHKQLKGENVDPHEYTLITKNGKRIEIIATTTIIQYENDHAILGIVTDITDRKRAEEKLKKSEIKYRSLVECALAGIAKVDLSGKFTFVNNALCNMIGYAEKELLGKPFANFLHPEEKNRILQIFRNIIKHPEQGIPIEFKVIHKKGHIIYLYSKPTPFIFNNKVIGFNAIITDITEMKQVAQALHESEEKYRTLVEQSLQGISIIQDNRFVFVNHALAEITGYTVDELLTFQQEKMEKVIHPDDLELIKRRFSDLAAGREITPQYEFRAIRKNGSVCWVEVFSNPITFKGRPARQLAYMDITERKEAEDAMRDSERRLSDIIQYLPDPTCVIDCEGRVIAWNKALEELTSVKAEEMLGKGNHQYSLPFYGKRRPVLMDLMLQPHNKEIEKLYPFVKKNRDTLITENYIPLLKGGIYIWVQVRPLYDSHGYIAGAISTVRNITERKQAEEALQKSEEKFRSLADQSLVGIYILKDRRIIYANQGFSDISGYSIDEMLRWKPEGFAQMIHPDEKDFVIEQGRKKQLGEKDVLSQYTYRMITKSGKIRTVETYSKTVPFEDGIADQGVVIDITERKEAEEALRESEEKFREIFENASDAIYTVDTFGNFTSGNKMAENITGYRREELIGKHFFTLVIEDDKQKAIESFKHILNGRHHSFSLKIRRKDEEISTLSVHAAPLIKNGDIVGSQGIARDISVQLKLEKKLKESEERFKGIFENAHDAIIVTNKAGFIILANPRFFELSGFSSQELNKIHLSQLIHPEDSDYILLYFNRAISGEMGYERFVTRGITKDGSIRYLDINANIMKKDKAIVGIQAIIRDITESKILEEKLRGNYKELIKTIAGFLEIKDLYTEKHSRRIVEDSIYLASKLNMNEKEIKDIEIGALLHDLGKIKIPGKILNKGATYNKEEEQIMRKHSQLGEEAIKNIPEFHNASKLIRHHHERYDGKGYPDKLQGEEIPLGARIIALVDAFDAMVSERPYRKALAYEKAKQELIREKGKQFDPYLTDIYLRYLESKYENK